MGGQNGSKTADKKIQLKLLRFGKHEIKVERIDCPGDGVIQDAYPALINSNSFRVVPDVWVLREDLRKMKLYNIKQSIQNGTYHINSRLIAEKIICMELSGDA